VRCRPLVALSNCTLIADHVLPPRYCPQLAGDGPRPIGQAAAWTIGHSGARGVVMIVYVSADTAADLLVLAGATTATRTRNPLLRRHFPNVAWHRPGSPDVGSSRSEIAGRGLTSPGASGRWLPVWLPEKTLATLTPERSVSYLCPAHDPGWQLHPVWEDRPTRPGDGPDRPRPPGMARTPRTGPAATGTRSADSQQNLRQGAPPIRSVSVT
jgi:hypothetical protein